jgi:hypothetical protein
MLAMKIPILKKYLRTLGGVLVGAVGGVLVAVAAQHSAGKPAITSHVLVDQRQEPAAEVVPSPPTRMPLPSPNETVSAVGVQLPRAKLAEPPSIRQSVDDLDPAAYQEALVSDHLAAIAAHDREGLDSSWARASEASLKNDLVPLAQARGFDVMSLDCRTKTCVAHLQFASFADAQTKWQSVLNMQNHAGCGTEVTLDVPTDPLARYDLSTVYDCSESRASVAVK